MSTKTKLGVAIDGTRWGSVHARAIADSEHATLRGFWSRTEGDAARALAKQYGVPLYTDHGKMLRELKPDVVTVAVPEAAHAGLTLEALDAGAHVYCEKVIADDRDAARQMVARAAKVGRRLNVGYNYRYSPSCRYLRQALEAGKLGQPLFAQLRAFTWCIHHMTDYAGSLLGKPRRAVAVFDREPLPGQPHISAPALAFPTFVYAAFTRKAYMVEYESGAILMAAATDYAPIEEPGATFLVQGSRGRAELDDLTGCVTLHGQGRESTLYRPSQICDKIGLRENAIAAVQDFVRAVAADEPTPIPGEQGLAMLCLEQAILRSAKSKRWEDVELAP
ncbi:MAG: Gfo/Idh/MocA family oxidoreductase [Planctomycetota bacterium]|nr:Gfo/Idh/MocA family oxidoreductase [Planctomycetota bacterium]